MKYLLFAPILLVLIIFGASLSAQSIDLPVTTKLVPHNILFDGKEEVTIRLKGLVVGDTYQVYVVQDEYNPPVAFSSLPNGLFQQSNTFLQGTVGAGVISFCLDALAPQLNGISVVIGKNIPAEGLNRDKLVGDTIEIEENNDIDFLLNTVFRKDTCFALFPGNIQGGRRIRSDGTFLGQTGIFRNGLPTVGIDSGIIVTTGWVQDAAGPNTPAASQNGPIDFFTTMNGQDADADALVPPGVDIYDLAILEFDFIPTTDTISFNYVFFSEQYCATLGGNVANDAFGFMLTGPDGNTVNIARLPVSDDIVSPATLNPGTVDAAYFLNNTTPAHGDPCMDTPPPPARLAGIGYDGFSTILTARGAVTPCARHTLKIVVLDANDALSDSGVLLEAGSFLAGLVNKPEPNTTAQIDVLQPVEGCDTATIKFTRRTLDEPFINRPLLVKYNIIPFFGPGATEATRAEDPGNTAGADYILPASPFVIPGGDTSAVLNIPILADGDFAEGLEAFIIRYDGTCDCSENADTFWIQDAVNYTVDIGPDQTLCAGNDVVLTATPTGGNGNYTFEWPNLTDTNRVTYTTTGRDTTIVVNVTDGCGLMGTGSVNILAPDFSVSAGGDYSLCSDPTADVLIDVSGTGPFIISLWVDSNNVITTTDYRVTGDTTFIFDVAANVTVNSITDLSGCGGAVSRDTARIRSADVAFTDLVEPALCDAATGSITITTDDGNNNFTFTWMDNPGETTGSRTMLSPGIYEVSIAPVSDPSCARVVQYDLSAPATLMIDTFNYTVPSCAGEAITLAPIVVGGTGAYTFSWPDSMSTDSLLSIVTQAGRNLYPVIVTDSCGRQATDTVEIDLPEFSVELRGRYSLCNSSPVVVPYTISGPAGTYSVELRIDSAGTSTTRVLIRPVGTHSLQFDYAANITIIGITNSDLCTGDTIMGTATVADPAIRFNVQVGSVSCNGGNDGEIILTDPANVPVTFAWSDSGPATALRTGLTAGSYTVTITDAADPACFRDTTIRVEEPQVFSLSVTNTPVSCPGEQSTFIPNVSGGTGPYVFNWENGMGVDSLYQITTVGGTTRYPLLVTDACGLSLRDTITLALSETRASVAGNFSICNKPFNADVPIVLSGSGPFTFVVRENMVDRTIVATGDTSLNYSAETTVQLISVTGADGCPGVAGGIANVTDGNFNVVPMVTDVLCQGQATGAIRVVVNGNNAAYTFSWDAPGLSGADVSGLRAGTYNLMVTDQSASACTWDTTFTILEPASAIILQSDSIRDQTCDLPGYAAATYTGGTGQLAYSWSNGHNTSVLGEVAPGLYTLSVTDENSCQVSQPFNIQDRRTTVLAAISTSADSLSCSLTSVTLSAQQNTFVVDYAWQDASGNDLGTNRRQVITMPGQYFVRVTNPANGCTATDSITIGRSDDLLELELPVQYEINCVNASVDLTVTHPAYSGPVDYLWRLNGTVVGSAATLANISATSIYEITVTRIDNGCPTVAQTEVIIDRNDPVVSVPEPVVSSTCRDPEVAIGVTANGPYSFSWSTTNGMLTGTTDAAITMAGGAGTYHVLVTDTLNGCTTNESISVVLNGATLTPDAGTDQPLICNGSGTVLNGSAAPRINGTEVHWYGPGGNEIGDGFQTFTLEEGQHILEVIHPVSGCSSFDTVQVFSEAATSVSYSLQQPPCPEVGGRLFVTEVIGLNGPFTYSSPTGETEPLGYGLRGLRVGTNILVVTDQFGCELRDTFQIFEGDEFTGTAEDVVIRLGEEAVLGINTNRTDEELTNWAWGNIGDSLTCLTCPNPVVDSPLETFIATVTVMDTNGCELSLRQNVIVDEQDLIYMPTAFSPANADGVNDVYTVFGNAEFVSNINFLHIFDRWGNRVFTNDDFPVNDPNEGWTGISRDGQYAPSAVYTYVVSYERWDGETEVRTGGFTLVR